MPLKGNLPSTFFICLERAFFMKHCSLDKSSKNNEYLDHFLHEIGKINSSSDLMYLKLPISLAAMKIGLLQVIPISKLIGLV